MTNILILDDCPSVREYLEMVLGKNGLQVFTASNSNEATAIYSREKIDILITDIILENKLDSEVLSGIDTILDIRKHDPKVKIIAISGGAGIGDKNDFLDCAKEHGADLTLSKPFSPEDILIAVDQLQGE